MASNTATMKLSEAMRAGAKLRPQGYGLLFELNKEGELCSCAMGAALEGATGITLSPSIVSPIPAKAKEALVKLDLYVDGPGGNFTKIGCDVVLRNDSRENTREEIADWLEARGY